MKAMLDIKSFLLEAASKKLNKKQDVAEQRISLVQDVLDKKELSNEDEKSMDTMFRPNGPMIYAFVTNKVQKCIKIGYTCQAPGKRIEQWKEKYGKNFDDVTCLGCWSSAEISKAGERVFFWDKPLHSKIIDRGYPRVTKDEFFNELITDLGREIKDLYYSDEFFHKYKKLLSGELDTNDIAELGPELIVSIMEEMKRSIREDDNPDFTFYRIADKQKGSKVWGAPDNYDNTNLQKEAIKNGVDALDKRHKTKLLMAAVMRFGKTHASYEIVNQMKYKRVIVTSAKADVCTAWRDDINHENFYKKFVFVDLKNMQLSYKPYDKDTILTEGFTEDTFQTLSTDKNRTLIIFDTLQGLSGSLKKLKDKHRGILDGEFDMMIIDETHYGSHASLFGQVTGLYNEDDDYDEEDLKKEAAAAEKDANVVRMLSKNCKTMLQVSGTPYYILASNEFIGSEDTEIISKVSYTDMIEARDRWVKENPDKEESDSPYYGVPTLHRIGLRLTKECLKYVDTNNMTTSLNKLFALDKKGKFQHSEAITDLMRGIFGDDRTDTIGFLKNKAIEGSKVCKHTMIVMPQIAMCQAMKDLLVSEKIIDESKREILVIVGEYGKGFKSIAQFNKKLSDLYHSGKKSLVITVKKWTTGVSMPMLDSMIYLKNASSPQDYDQTIFRLCTRNVENYTNKDGIKMKVNNKHNVYLIDFNIENMLNMMINSAQMKADAEGNRSVAHINELIAKDIQATPVFSEANNGELLGKMHQVTAHDMLKMYAGYNENKGVAAVVDDGISMTAFDKLISNHQFQKMIYLFKVSGKIDTKKADKFGGFNRDDEGEGTIVELTNPDGSEKVISTDPDISDDTAAHIENVDRTLAGSIKQQTVSQKDKNKMKEELLNKFKHIIKWILYCNLCLDDPCPDMETFIKRAKTDNRVKSVVRDFGFSDEQIDELEDINKFIIKMHLHDIVRRLIFSISLLMQDKNQKNYDRFITGVAGLGTISNGSEHVTPPSLVSKMIDKLPTEEYKKADTILLVNEKCGEFVSGLMKKEGLGIDVAKKCRIVCSSLPARNLCKRMLNTIGLNDYIDTMILGIEDRNNDRMLCDDFLKMLEKNGPERFMKKFNDGKKFDVCLMNPPYSGTLHLKFLEQVIKISDNIICVHPIDKLVSPKLIYAPYSIQEYAKLEPTLKHCNSVEKIDARSFGIGIQSEVGITTWTHIAEKNWSPDKFVLFTNEQQQLIIKIMKKIKMDGDTNNLFYFVKHRNNSRGDIVQWIPAVHGNVRQDGGKQKDFYEIFSKDYNKAISVKEPKNRSEASELRFKTEEERKNFIDSTFLETHKKIMSFWKTDTKIRLKFIPWLHDYSKKWTDNMIMDFFNLNNKEKEILNNMELKY